MKPRDVFWILATFVIGVALVVAFSGSHVSERLVAAEGGAAALYLGLCALCWRYLAPDEDED